MHIERQICGNLARDGFEVIADVLDETEVDDLLQQISAIDSEGVAGIRQPHLSIPSVRNLAGSPATRDLVEPNLGGSARLVRSILFDKTPTSNWSVPWHQDLTIALADRAEIAGFLGWSMKDGVHHVQAPPEILEQMLTVRLHLDDCRAENGPLRVLPGSHTDGWLDSNRIDQLKDEIPERLCIVPRGGALLMRPLLLHASSRAKQPGHRRVLHLEFASAELPGGLKFAT